jgi:hypothetical protein
MQERLEQIVGKQRIVMTFEMDDYFLAPLEEVAYYEKHHELDFNDVYRIFGDYIDVCWQNSEIVKYIKWVRANYKANVYRNMEALQTKLRSHYEKLKSKGLAAV